MAVVTTGQAYFPRCLSLHDTLLPGCTLGIEPRLGLLCRWRWAWGFVLHRPVSAVADTYTACGALSLALGLRLFATAVRMFLASPPPALEQANGWASSVLHGLHIWAGPKPIAADDTLLLGCNLGIEPRFGLLLPLAMHVLLGFKGVVM